MLNSKLDLSLKFFFFIFLVILASILSSSMSLDSAAYHGILEKIRSESDFFSEVRFTEPFFIFLAKILSGFGDFFWFLLIAFFSVSLKVSLIEKSSRSFWISSSVYFSYFFVLLDGTQVRVSLAIIIAFWGGYLFSNRQFFLGFFLVFISAIFFHYSLVFFVFVCFFVSKRSSFYISILWPISIIFWFFGFDFVHLLNWGLSPVSIDLIGVGEFKRYLLHVNLKAHPYSIQFIIMYIVSLSVFYFYREVLSDFEVVCFNCLFFSFFMLGLFVGVDSVANRLSEIFRFGIIFIAPLYYRFFLEIFKKRWLVNFFFIFALVGYFYFYIIHAGLIVWPKG